MEEQDEAPHVGAEIIWSKSHPDYSDAELLHDYKGVPYQISEQYYKTQIDKRKDTSIAHKIAKSVIESGFKMLTLQQRKVMSLAVEGVTERQIGEIMGISAPRVHQLKKAAGKKLRKYIPQFGTEENTNGTNISHREIAGGSD